MGNPTTGQEYALLKAFCAINTEVCAGDPDVLPGMTAGEVTEARIRKALAPFFAALTPTAETEATADVKADAVRKAWELLENAQDILGRLGDGVGLPKLKRPLVIQGRAEYAAIEIGNLLDEWPEAPAALVDAGREREARCSYCGHRISDHYAKCGSGAALPAHQEKSHV